MLNSRSILTVVAVTLLGVWAGAAQSAENEIAAERTDHSHGDDIGSQSGKPAMGQE